MFPESFPVIVKPTDRSGSRAITKVYTQEELEQAITQAAEQSFENRAIVEEYIEGAEYSVETISYKGEHTCLAVTKNLQQAVPIILRQVICSRLSYRKKCMEKFRIRCFVPLTHLKSETAQGTASFGSTKREISGSLRLVPEWAETASAPILFLFPQGRILWQWQWIPLPGNRRFLQKKRKRFLLFGFLWTVTI